VIGSATGGVAGSAAIGSGAPVVDASAGGWGVASMAGDSVSVSAAFAGAVRGPVARSVRFRDDPVRTVSGDRRGMGVFADLAGSGRLGGVGLTRQSWLQNR
jgi:hypothetical protein